MTEPEKPVWLAEGTRAVRDIVQDNGRTARLIAILLALTIAVAATAWYYQTITSRPGPQDQVTITVTNC